MKRKIKQRIGYYWPMGMTGLVLWLLAIGTIASLVWLLIQGV